MKHPSLKGRLMEQVRRRAKSLTGTKQGDLRSHWNNAKFPWIDPCARRSPPAQPGLLHKTRLSYIGVLPYKSAIKRRQNRTFCQCDMPLQRLTRLQGTGDLSPMDNPEDSLHASTNEPNPILQVKRRREAYALPVLGIRPQRKGRRSDG